MMPQATADSWLPLKGGVGLFLLPATKARTGLLELIGDNAAHEMWSCAVQGGHQLVQLLLKREERGSEQDQRRVWHSLSQDRSMQYY